MIEMRESSLFWVVFLGALSGGLLGFYSTVICMWLVERFMPRGKERP